MTEEKEIWKDIKGYEGQYQVSNLGRVKSLNYRGIGKEQILIPSKQTTGYLFVVLHKNGTRKTFTIHRLAAQAFIENHENLPCVNHIDEDKTNNCVDNLEWCSHEYNINYGTHNARCLETKKLKKCKNAEKPVLQFTKANKFIKEFPSIHEATRCTGINKGNICSCFKGRRTTAGGFVWKYKNNE